MTTIIKVFKRDGINGRIDSNPPFVGNDDEQLRG
jgi:hypothetical protein